MPALVALLFLGLIAAGAMAMVWRPLPNWTLIALSFVLMVVMTAFLLGAVAAGAGEVAPPWTHWITEPTLSLAGIDASQLEGDNLRHALDTALSVLLAGITLWFAVIVPVNVIVKLKAKHEADRTVDIKPIEKPHGGIDTLEDLLRGCREAIIFSGDFDWLFEKTGFKERIVALAVREKITLVSNEETSVVEEALKSDRAARKKIMPRVRWSGREKFHLTYVWYDGKANACCSMVTHDHGTANERRENIIIRSERRDSLVLLDIIEQLVDIDSWKKEPAK